jgi:hypothetical protein
MKKTVIEGLVRKVVGFWVQTATTKGVSLAGMVLAAF